MLFLPFLSQKPLFSQKIKDLFKWPFFVALFAVGLFLFFITYAGLQLEPVAAAGEPGCLVAVNIPQGSSTREIGNILEKAGLIKSSDFFVLYTRYLQREKDLQAGEYNISTKLSLSSILEVIAGGQVVYHKVTIPEGYTVKQIAGLLSEKGLVDKERFFKAVNSEDFSLPFLDEDPLCSKKLEGFLFPSTYMVRAGMTETEIVQMMVDRFTEVFSPELKERACKMGLSEKEVITLASLVEKEAKLDQERPLIAGVFLNRLRKGMRLESCATVLYALGEAKEELTYEDLEIDSPYNTYRHQGLPPGPIANPGVASIKAVLYPATTDYLYFVAKGDGSHYFSRSLEEHQTATRCYQK